MSVATTSNNTQDVNLRIFYGLFLSSGVIGFLLLYGQLQEKIMSHRYNGDKFEHSVFLVSCNRIIAVVFAVALAMYYKESFRSKAPIWKYFIVSASNVLASTCQYEALKYVTFAVQVLGKSFKIMPVMIWGMAISKKSYRVLDWVIASLVTMGCTEFLLTGPTCSKSQEDSVHYGYILLLAFLVFDGLTSTMQEKLFREHETTKYNQMLYINFLSCIIGTGTQLAQGTLSESFHFLFAHGDFLRDSLILSVSAVGGQFFIYSQVKEFGAVAFAATMNARQIVSIASSYVAYGHHITILQLIGLAVAFAALFFKVYLGFMGEKKRKEADKMKLEKAALLSYYIRKESDMEAGRSYQSTSQKPANQ